MKFLKYVENEEPVAQRKFKGIATVSVCEGKYILSFVIQDGKEGRGYFITPFSKMLNNEWVRGVVIDSNYESEELFSMIRQGVNAYYNKSYSKGTAKQTTFEDGDVPF